MLSFNLLAGWTVMGKTLFDWLDFLTSRWMMPLGGILMVLLAGYALPQEISGRAYCRKQYKVNNGAPDGAFFLRYGWCALH